MADEIFLLNLHVAIFLAALLLASLVGAAIAASYQRSEKNYRLAIVGSVLKPRQSFIKTFMELVK